MHVESTPVTNASPDIAVRVRMVEIANGVTSQARVAASFSHAAAAEDFIRGEVTKWKSFGCHNGHNWGRNSADHQVRYWIETQQETASVKEEHQRAGNAPSG